MSMLARWLRSFRGSCSDIRTDGGEDSDARIESLRKQLAQASARGDVQSGRRVCEQILARVPDDSSTLGVIATLSLLAGDVAGAESWLGKLLPQPGMPRLLRNALFDIEQVKRKQPYVAQVKNVLVETAFWSVIAHDKVYNVEVHGRALEKSPFVKGRAAPDGSAFIMALPPPSLTVADPCVHLGGDENYCHWITRNLMKLALLEDHPAQALPLLINEDLRPYQVDLLDILGIAPSRLVKVPRGEVVGCAELYVPTLLRSHWKMHIGIDWLRSKVAHLTAAVTAQRLLYVSRADSAARCLVNEEEVLDQLRPLGFERIVPGRMSVVEQINAFASARVIVAPHGAALANMIFAPLDAAVVEIISGYKLPMTGFREMAKSLGQSFERVVSEDYVVTRPESYLANTDFRVDPHAVVGALRKVAPWLTHKAGQGSTAVDG